MHSIRQKKIEVVQIRNEFGRVGTEVMRQGRGRVEDRKSRGKDKRYTAKI